MVRTILNHSYVVRCPPITNHEFMLALFYERIMRLTLTPRYSDILKQQEDVRIL